MVQKHGLMLLIPAAVEPLGLEETKEYLKINIIDDDILIGSLIKTVRNVAELFMRRSLITQSWKLSYNKYAPGTIILPKGPVQSVSSIALISRDSVRRVLPANNYYLACDSKLIFDATPMGHLIEIIYVTGYGDTAAAVPPAIREGMLAHLAAIYDGKVSKNVLPGNVTGFYGGFRVLRV